jgi:hypothetical protein
VTAIIWSVPSERPAIPFVEGRPDMSNLEVGGLKKPEDMSFLELKVRWGLRDVQSGRLEAKKDPYNLGFRFEVPKIDDDAGVFYILMLGQL